MKLYFVGRNIDIAKGKALDMSQAANAAREHTVVKAANGPEDMKDSKIVVITCWSTKITWYESRRLTY